MSVGENQFRSAFKGVKICGNVWGCPVCSARISQTRRGEMNTLLAWSRENNLFPVMLTLTTRHGRDDRLGDMLERMKRAKERLRQRREWRRLPFIGSVTATEITHGTRNGWHPHFHEIVILEASSEEEALELVRPLGDAWRASLKGQGLDGAEVAFDAQEAGSAGDYVTKWGVAEEVTLSNSRQARNRRRVRAGRPVSSLGWLVRVTRKLVNSGLNTSKQHLVVVVVSSSGQRSERPLWADRGDGRRLRPNREEEKEQELASWDNEGWRRVRSKRVRLMEAGERGGSSAVRLAEAGPDDEAVPEAFESVIDDTADDDFDKEHAGLLNCSQSRLGQERKRSHAQVSQSTGPHQSAEKRGWTMTDDEMKREKRAGERSR